MTAVATAPLPVLPEPAFEQPVSVTDPQSGITYQVQDVTPEIASYLLGLNTSNRAISTPSLNKYIKDMIGGMWDSFSPDMIVLSDENVLLNGQTRLTAILMTGQAQRFMIARNVPSEAQAKMDTGKNRSLADALSLEGHDKGFANVLSPAINWCLQYEHGFGRRYAASHTEALDWIDENVGLIDVVNWVQENNIPSRTGISRTMLSGLIFEAKGIEDIAKQFVLAYGKAIGLEEGDPALLLLNTIDRLSRERRRRSAIHYNGIMIKAFNKYALGQKTKLLRFAPDPKDPAHREQFPTIMTAIDMAKIQVQSE